MAAAWRLLANETINFAIGQPCRQHLANRLIASSASRLSSSNLDVREYLQYGDSAGNEVVLNSLASFLSHQVNETIDPAELVITNGVSHGLELLSSITFPPSLPQSERVCLVEQPTYFLAAHILKDHGVELLGVPRTFDGRMDISKLKGWLGNARLCLPRPKMLYTVPIHNNPSAATMPRAQLTELASVCAQHDITVAADEVYQLLTFPPYNVPPSIVSTQAPSSSTDAPVVSLSSFSKILGPGCRFGWIRAPPQLKRKLSSRGVLISGGGVNPLMGGIVYDAIESGALAEHCAVLRADLHKRAQALIDSLDRHLPSGSFELVHDVQGGYFLWLKLYVADTSSFLEFCKEHYGVTFLPGSRAFCADREVSVYPGTSSPGSSFVRLCFAYHTIDEMDEGAKRLGRAIASYDDKK